MGGGQALEGTRAPAFRMDCDDIKVPGKDKVGRSHGPPELIKAHAGRLDLGERGLWKPGFVESIADDDVMETVVVWKDGDGTPWCVDGVQRVLGGREAKKIRKARGDPRPVLIPTLSPIGKVDDVHRFALSLKLNSMRHDDPPLVRAGKAAELYKMAVGAVVNGRPRTEAEAKKLVADAIGEKVGVVSEMLKLDSAPAAVKGEVLTGTLGPTAAVALQGVPVEQQRGLLDGVRRSGPATTARVKEAVAKHKATKDGRDSGDAKVTPSKATIRSVYGHEGAEEALSGATAWQLLRWQHGDLTPRGVPGLGPILREIEGPGGGAE